ncbi:hypothetical protein DFH28DRAFT_910254 [Melampsora americana]|nr:hypothetical protein DFH28DRAFT_910254 [Melampsora americana]
MRLARHHSWATLPNNILSKIFDYLPNWWVGVPRIVLTRVCRHWYDVGIYVCWKRIMLRSMDVIKLQRVALARPVLAAMTRELVICNRQWFDNFPARFWKALTVEEKGIAADFEIFPERWLPNAQISYIE